MRCEADETVQRVRATEYLNLPLERNSRIVGLKMSLSLLVLKDRVLD